MKLRLMTLTALGALSLGGAALAQNQDMDGRERHEGRGGHKHASLERITEKLNLTPDQKTRVQPILDQAQPKIAAIHQEAMQKSKAILDEAMGQIRPMLTPEQQKQLDDLQTRRGREGHHGHHGDDDDSPF